MQSTRVIPVVGSLPEVLENSHGLYIGNLRKYLPIVANASNVFAPYHNLRHMLHVTVMCYSALLYQRESGREMHHVFARVLLLAGLFHDFDHLGNNVDDDVNIDRAINALHRHHLEEDRILLPAIEGLIKTTRYPYRQDASEIKHWERILRDADKSLVFSIAWIQQVAGLGKEKGLTLKEALEKQLIFLRELSFDTEWGRFMFQDAGQITSKIVETERLLACYS